MTKKTCNCAKPVPVERSERKGAARTECGRCNLQIPLRLPTRAA